MAIITLADAKQQLNIPPANTNNDTELQVFIDAAEVAIERLAGVVTPRAVTEITSTRRGSPWALMLATTPVISLTSMTAQLDGTTYDVSALYVTPDGIVRRNDGAAITCGAWSVEYQAGRDSVPGNIALACRILVQHLWETQRGAPGPLVGTPLASSDERRGDQAGMWFAIPNKIRELLSGEQRSLPVF